MTHTQSASADITDGDQDADSHPNSHHCTQTAGLAALLAALLLAEPLTGPDVDLAASRPGAQCQCSQQPPMTPQGKGGDARGRERFGVCLPWSSTLSLCMAGNPIPHPLCQVPQGLVRNVVNVFSACGKGGEAAGCKQPVETCLQYMFPKGHDTIGPVV